LYDVAQVAGATVVEPSVGDWQKKLELGTVGAVETAKVGFDETVLIGGRGDIKQRVSDLKNQLTNVKKDEKEEIQQRIAKLQGKVGIVRIGGTSETEVAEKKYRVDDAVGAVRAAMKSGIVPGGGVTLRDIAEGYSGSDIKDAVHSVLRTPYRLLLENSGYGEDNYTDKVGFGLNVLSGEEINMVKGGIIDPLDVTLESVRNAFTIAGLAITVGGSIVDKQLTQNELSSLMAASSN